MAQKTALVTGAGMGVGLGIARELGSAGYEVAVHYHRSDHGAKDLCRQIELQGGRAFLVQADTSKLEGIRNLFCAVEKRFERLDVFVSNSGITDGGQILDATEEQFDRICDLNWKGTYFCVKQAADFMVKTKSRGSIVIIGSNQMDIVRPGNSMYGSMKYALERFTQGAAMEMARHGIRVNCIAPGYVDTGAPRMGSKEKTYDEIPMRRWVSLEEIGQAVLYVCGPYAASLTGETIILDGGAHLISTDPKVYGFQ